FVIIVSVLFFVLCIFSELYIGLYSFWYIDWGYYCKLYFSRYCCCMCSRSFTYQLFLFGCTGTDDCTRAGDASSRTENRRGMEKDLEICCKCGSAQSDCLYFSAYCDDFYPSQLCCSGAGI